MGGSTLTQVAAYVALWDWLLCHLGLFLFEFEFKSRQAQDYAELKAQSALVLMV
jgi:hypothetical protein